MKKIALSLVLVTGLALAACSQPTETTVEAPDAAAPAEGAMTEGETATDAAMPAEGAMTEAAPAAEGAMTEEKK